MEITKNYLIRHGKRYREEMEEIQKQYSKTKDFKELSRNIDRIISILHKDKSLYYGSIFYEMGNNEYCFNYDLNGILIRIPSTEEFKDIKQIEKIYLNDIE